MSEKEFMEELNKRFNEFASIFQQVNQNKEDVGLRTNALINLSCFSHFVIEHGSFIETLPKENLSIVYTLLSIAKSENLNSAFELGTILETQGISR